MPELPEVESVAACLRPELTGQTLEAWAHSAKRMRYPYPANMPVGCSLKTVSRRGKYLILLFDPTGIVVVHLGMTGQLWQHHKRTGMSMEYFLCQPHHHVVWQFTDTILVLKDVRRFGGVLADIHTTDSNAIKPIAILGPEPLSDDWQVSSLCGGRRAIHTLLMEQSIVAGIGNIYAAEACYLAKINPAQTNLNSAQAKAAHNSARTSLLAGIEHKGTSAKDYILPNGIKGQHQNYVHVYGREGQPCHRCKTFLIKIKLSGRTACFCPRCQPLIAKQTNNTTIPIMA